MMHLLANLYSRRLRHRKSPTSKGGVGETEAEKSFGTTSNKTTASAGQPLPQRNQNLHHLDAFIKIPLHHEACPNQAKYDSSGLSTDPFLQKPKTPNKPITEFTREKNVL